MQTISVVIITWNRPLDALHCLECLSQQLIPNEWELEVAMINNGSNKEYEEVNKFLHAQSSTSFKVIYKKLPHNIGTGGGRNAAIQMTSGSIVIFLDDDAWFQDNNGIAQVILAYEALKKEGSDTEIIAFRILDPTTQQVRGIEFPHKLRNDKETLESFYTYYFIGAGFAATRYCLDRINGFDNDFFYGGEELELSCKFIAMGGRILYNPSIAVYHARSPSGRHEDAKVRIEYVANHLTIAYWYLPIRLIVRHAFLRHRWLTQSSKKDIYSTLRGLLLAWKKMRKKQRMKLNPKAMQYLVEVGAM